MEDKEDKTVLQVVIQGFGAEREKIFGSRARDVLNRIPEQSWMEWNNKPVVESGPLFDIIEDLGLTLQGYKARSGPAGQKITTYYFGEGLPSHVSATNIDIFGTSIGLFMTLSPNGHFTIPRIDVSPAEKTPMVFSAIKVFFNKKKVSEISPYSICCYFHNHWRLGNATDPTGDKWKTNGNGTFSLNFRPSSGYMGVL